MKILLVNKFHNVKGGSETYYFALGEMLNNAGHEVIYFSMKDEKNASCEQEKYFVENIDFNADLSKFETVVTAFRLLYSFEAKSRFEKLIINEKPDIIHLNLFQSQLTGSIVDVAKKYKIPVVYTAHDLKCICPNYKMMNREGICEKCTGGNYTNCFKFGCMKDSKLKSLLAAAEAYVYKFRATYKKMDFIITPSDFYRRKINEAKVADCPVVHMTNFLPKGTEYSVSNRGSYLLYFGRLSHEKGIISLIEAYAKSGVNIPLYIAGRGPIEGDIKEFINKNKLNDRVYLLGFKKQSELKQIIKDSLCVCLASEWYENCPCSIMEAMALGKPVIVNDIGGLPEIVVDGETGFVVPAFDTDALSKSIIKMCNLSDDAILKMGTKAVEYAKENYDSDIYLGKLLNIYNDLVGCKL